MEINECGIVFARAHCLLLVYQCRHRNMDKYLSLCLEINIVFFLYFKIEHDFLNSPVNAKIVWQLITQ